jgi:signal transduction histidine kinase
VIRAIRELLINAKRHSKCDLIQIDLSAEKIIVKDNGIGGLETKDNSYGIVGVKERLQLIGAEVLLSSEFSGTKIEILLKQ